MAVMYISGYEMRNVKRNTFNQSNCQADAIKLFKLKTHRTQTASRETRQEKEHYVM